MQAATMRRLVLSATVLWAASCYSPRLSNFGFACDSTAPKPCPDGYFCHDGYCDDGSGGRPPQPGTGGNGGGDMSVGAGGGGGGGGGGTGGGGGMGGGKDMAMAPPDLAMAPPDLAQPPPDLSKPVSTCAHNPCSTGGKLASSCDTCVQQVCAADSLCCSSTWDSICVGEYKQACPSTCP